MNDGVAGWWAKAQSSMDKAARLLKWKWHEDAIFYAQQAAERGLKALLLQREDTIIKTHDLPFLAKRVGAPATILTLCKELSPVYMESRYPTTAHEWREYTREEAESDLRRAQEILLWIKKNL